MVVFTNEKGDYLAILEGFKKLCALPYTCLIALERRLSTELVELLDQELMWFQKSMEWWIVEGDRNTSFYHTNAVIKGTKK